MPKKFLTATAIIFFAVFGFYFADKNSVANAAASWSTGLAGGTARISHTAALHNGKIYFWGGQNNSGVRFSTMDIYDITGNSWSTGLAGGTARHGHTATLHNGKIYFWGGESNTPSFLNTIDIYDIASNSWSTGLAGGTARVGHTGTLYNGKIYFEGGHGLLGFTTTIDIYDIAGNSWSTVSGGVRRASHTGTLYNGKIYYWGGSDFTGVRLDLMEIYDIAANSWSLGVNRGAVKSGHAANLYNGKIYFWGGLDETGSLSNTIDIYDVATNNWSGSGVLGEGTLRQSHTGTLYNGKIYYWGGQPITSATTLDIYDFGSGQNSNNVSGFAWSENVGWISLNSSNCDTDNNSFSNGGAGCPAVGTAMAQYGVSIAPVTGLFSGHAWSENIGWIDFAPAGPYPSTPGYSAKADLSTGQVSGWARALANDSSWDGWIKLRENSTSTFTPKVDYTTGSSPRSVAIGDVNGDAKADLAVANRSDNTISIFINNGNGTFAPKVDYTTGPMPDSVAIGDVNGDAKADLVATGFFNNTVSVLINNGTGTFAPKVDYTTGTGPLSVAIGDVNGDAKADLAVANYNSNSISIFINNGTGIFAPKVDYTAGSLPKSVAIGDVNGDAKPDLAVPNSGDTISILINNGTGTFAPRVGYAAGFSPYSVAIGDVNGDAKPDLAVANRGGNNVSIFINNGTGIFAPKVDYAAGSGSRSVAMSDLNGDAKIDLAVANTTGNNVSILINNGNGTFIPKVDYTTGIWPYSVAMGDVNGDTKVDLATTGGDGTIATDITSVFINRTGANYGVLIDRTTGAFSGYAWSDAVIGWIKFNGPGYGAVAPPSLFTPPSSPPTALMGCDTTLCSGGSCTGTWTAYQPTAQLPCNYRLVNSSTDPDNDIARTEWHIKKSIEPDTSYRLMSSCLGICDRTLQSTDVPDPDSYSAKLYVQDGNGASSIDTRSILVVKREINADFTCSLTGLAGSWQACPNLVGKVNKGERVYFNDTSNFSESAIQITSRTWAINGTTFSPGGAFGINETGPYVQLSSASNIIRLTVQDDLGRTDWQEYTIGAKAFLPEFKEVPPVIWLKKMFAVVSAALGF